MASVEGIRGLGAAGAGLAGPSARRRATLGAEAAPAETSSGRALIAIAPALRSDSAPPTSRRPSAHFLAHLIATAQHAPQTRERRRAEPEVVIATYRAAVAAPTIPAGRILTRSC